MTRIAISLIAVQGGRGAQVVERIRAMSGSQYIRTERTNNRPSAIASRRAMETNIACLYQIEVASV